MTTRSQALTLLVLILMPATAAAQRFGALETISTAARYPQGFSVSDFDGDGDGDVIATDESRRLQLHTNNGPGAGWATVTLHQETGNNHVVQRRAVAVDIDSDGDDDAVFRAGVIGGSTGYRWLENVAGQFGTQQYLVWGGSVHETFADLDADGDVDFTYCNGSNYLIWVENGVVYQEWVFMDEYNSPDETAVADVDGDGLADILSIHEDGRIYWFPNGGSSAHGPARFGTREVVRWATATENSHTFCAADVDGDGAPDLIVGKSSSGGLGWLRNDGAGHFTEMPDIAAGGLRAYRLVVQDLDGDGRPDVAAVMGDFTIQWFRNLPGGQFLDGELVHDGSGSAPAHIRCADIDGDGSIDIAATFPNSTFQPSGVTIGWFSNDGIRDCNGNSVPDHLDIASGASQDCNANGEPDECEIATGAEQDCDGSGILDSCELSADPQLDCNGNGLLDTCDLAAGELADCNSNGVLDVCEIAQGQPDCDGDGILDACQLSADLTLDLNGNAVLDSCESIGIPLCQQAVANSTGESASVLGFGTNVVFLNDFSLGIRNLPLNSFGFFIVSQTPGSVFPVANSDGVLCVVGNVGRGAGGGIFNAGTSGAHFTAVDLQQMPQPSMPVAVQPGETWYFQAWHRDVNPTLTSNFSEALSVTFQ